jgi:NhaA family Na+:H+ antiporter
MAARLRTFITTETAGGAVLLIAAVVAIVAANSPIGDAYRRAVTHDLGPLDLHAWVSDALMTVFFLVVGLELSRELTRGELRDRRVAALPVLAAAGGMVVPALVHLAWNFGTPGARGFGIPMATDIAFAVGIARALGRRSPTALVLFLLALAIADDLGAIVVIAAAYADGLDVVGLAVAVAAVVLVWRTRGHPVAVVVLAPLTWWGLHRAGIHQALAGAALGFAIPDPWADRYEDALHPVSTFVVVPLFALVSAGVVVEVPHGAGLRVAAGVALGLVVGKPLGITLASWLALRTGAATLPPGLTLRHVVGVGAIAGIGFTVSLVVTDLAFPAHPDLASAARLAIVAASLVAAVAGALLIRRADPG